MITYHKTHLNMFQLVKMHERVYSALGEGMIKICEACFGKMSD